VARNKKAVQHAAALLRNPDIVFPHDGCNLYRAMLGRLREFIEENCPYGVKVEGHAAGWGEPFTIEISWETSYLLPGNVWLRDAKVSKTLDLSADGHRALAESIMVQVVAFNRTLMTLQGESNGRSVKQDIETTQGETR